MGLIDLNVDIRVSQIYADLEIKLNTKRPTRPMCSLLQFLTHLIIHSDY